MISNKKTIWKKSLVTICLGLFLFSAVSPNAYSLGGSAGLGRRNFEPMWPKYEDKLDTDWGGLGESIVISVATAAVGMGLGELANSAGNVASASAVASGASSTVGTAVNIGTQAVVYGAGMGVWQGLTTEWQGGDFSDGFITGFAGGAVTRGLGAAADLGVINSSFGGTAIGAGIGALVQGGVGYAVSGKEGLIIGGINGAISGGMAVSGFGERISESVEDRQNDFSWQRTVEDLAVDASFGFASYHASHTARSGVKYKYQDKMRDVQYQAMQEGWSDEKLEDELEDIYDKMVIWSGVAGGLAAGVVTGMQSIAEQGINLRRAYKMDLDEKNEFIVEVGQGADGSKKYETVTTSGRDEYGKVQYEINGDPQDSITVDKFAGEFNLKVLSSDTVISKEVFKVMPGLLGGLGVLAGGALRGGLSGLGSGLAITMVDYRDEDNRALVQLASSLGARIGEYAGDALATYGPDVARGAINLFREQEEAKNKRVFVGNIRTISGGKIRGPFFSADEGEMDGDDVTIKYNGHTLKAKIVSLEPITEKQKREWKAEVEDSGLSEAIKAKKISQIEKMEKSGKLALDLAENDMYTKSPYFDIKENKWIVSVYSGGKRIKTLDYADLSNHYGVKVKPFATRPNWAGGAPLSGGTLVSSSPSFLGALGNLGLHAAYGIFSVENLSLTAGDLAQYAIADNFEGGYSVRGAALSTLSSNIAQMVTSHGLSHLNIGYMNPIAREDYQKNVEEMKGQAKFAKALTEVEPGYGEGRTKEDMKNELTEYLINEQKDKVPEGEREKYKGDIESRVNDWVGSLDPEDVPEAACHLEAQRIVKRENFSYNPSDWKVFTMQVGRGTQQALLSSLSSGVGAAIGGASWDEAPEVRSDADGAMRDYLVGGIIMPALSGAIQGVAGHFYGPIKILDAKVDKYLKEKGIVDKGYKVAEYAAISPMEEPDSDSTLVDRGLYHASNAAMGALIGIGEAHWQIFRQAVSYGHPGANPGIAGFSNYVNSLNNLHQALSPDVNNLHQALSSDEGYSSGYWRNIYNSSFGSNFKGAVTAFKPAAKFFAHRVSYLNRVKRPEIVVQGREIELAEDFSSEADLKEALEKNGDVQINIYKFEQEYVEGGEILRDKLQNDIKTVDEQLGDELVKLGLAQDSLSDGQKQLLKNTFGWDGSNSNQLVEKIVESYPGIERGNKIVYLGKGIKVVSGPAGPAWRFANPYAKGASIRPRLFTGIGYKGPLALSTRDYSRQRRINSNVYRYLLDREDKFYYDGILPDKDITPEMYKNIWGTSLNKPTG